jgi:hypothetical protein
VVAHAGEYAAEFAQVASIQRLEQELPDDLDVAGQDLCHRRASGVGDRDQDAALVAGRGDTGEQAGLLEEAGLVWSGRCGCRRHRRRCRSSAVGHQKCR